MSSPVRKAARPCRVSAYSGYKADEYPASVAFGDSSLEVIEIEDRWYDPAAAYFRVFAADARRYLLRRDTASGEWTVQEL